MFENGCKKGGRVNFFRKLCESTADTNRSQEKGKGPRKSRERGGHVITFQATKSVKKFKGGEGKGL